MKIQTQTPALAATAPPRPPSAKASLPPQDIVVKNNAPEGRLVIHRPFQTAVCAAASGAAGVGLGYLATSTRLGAALGGAVGLALGVVLGERANRLAYSTDAKLREWGNQIKQTTAELNKNVRGAQDPGRFLPLTQANQVAARPSGQMPRRYDGYDSSRDVVGLYAKEGVAGQPYSIEVEVAHLRPAAEHGHLDTTILVSWGEPGGSDKLPAPLQGSAAPWKVAVKIDHDQALSTSTPDGSLARDNSKAHHSTVFNRVQLQLDKETLRKQGWQDGQPLRLEAVTSADGDSQVASGLRADSNGQADSSKIFRWEGKTVYYAVTDRFSNGDTSNDGNADPKDPQRFHGGDWQGVIDKLDYLKDLNIDCVWLSPPYLNQRNYDDKDGFHGYWPMDFEKTDPNWGDRDKLKELVEKAHERGIKVMLDVVLNHSGYGHPFVGDPDKKDWFHKNGNISGLGQWQMENGALCGLPDFAQENPEVSHYLVEVHKDWLKDVDAFRMDALRHMPEKFLRTFNEEMHKVKPDFYSVGEAFWLDSNFVAGYQNRTTDSMFDFPLAYAVRRTLAGDASRTLKDRIDLWKEVKPHASQHEAWRMLLDSHKSQDMKLISDVLNNDRLYDNPNKLGTFIDNHDMVRFASDIGGDERRLEQALAFLFAVRGTPHVYYGTEVGMEGIGAANRDDMEWGKNPQMTETFRHLSQAHRDSQALQYGSQQELYCGKDTYAFSRMRPDEEVVCLFNKGDKPEVLSIPLHPESPIPEQARLKDMFNGQEIEVKDHALSVTIPAKGYSYLRWQAH